MSANLEFTQTIRDPVHGSIPITDLEARLLKTQCVSKLRWIKQMGLAFFSFPGANHTRFEHSIGAMHVASLMFDKLSRSMDEGDRRQITKHMQELRLAALFHDLGHAPFSHTMEEFFNRYPEYLPENSKHDHEYYTKKIITCNSEIQQAIDRVKGPIPDQLNLDYIANLSVGDDDVFGNLFSGTLDVDRMDYIMRDNYYCGLPFGSIDMNALISGLSVEKQGRKYVIFYSKDALSSIEGFLVSKFQLARTVFNHPKNRSMALRFFNCLKAAYDELLSYSVDQEASLQTISSLIHNQWTDYDVFYFIENPLLTVKIYDRTIQKNIKTTTNYENESEGSKLSKILSGNSPDNAFPFAHQTLSSSIKYDLYLLSLKSLYQRKLCDKLDEGMLDITFVKVEPYKVDIQMEDERRGIREVSPLVDSLVKSCLNEINLSFYAQRNPNKPIPERDIRDLLAHIRNSKKTKPFPTDLILLVNYYLHNWVDSQDDIKQKSLFFQSDTRFQAFFAEVTRSIWLPYEETIKMQETFADLTNVKNISSACYPYYSLGLKTDLDILTHLGLMYSRISVVEVPEDGVKKYYNRVERRTSRAGREYVENFILKNTDQTILNTLEENLTAVLTAEKPVILKSLKVDSKDSPLKKKLIGESKKDLLVVLGI